MSSDRDIVPKVMDKPGENAGASVESASEGREEFFHACFLSQAIEKFFLDETSSDMVLIVEKQRFCVHKNILAIRSNYFRALFYGNLKEAKESEIELKEIAIQPFQLVLKFAYSSKIDLKNLKEEIIMETLQLARQFIIVDLEIGIINYLKTIIRVANCCIILDHAIRFQMTAVRDFCVNFAENNTEKILEDESFLKLSATALIEIIARDSFCEEEITIFRAVESWIEQNKPTNFENIVCHIRLPLIDMYDLLKDVRESTLFSDSAILSAIDTQVYGEYREINHRNVLIVGENIALEAFGARVINGKMPQFLLNGDSTTYDNQVGYTWHAIQDKKGITIELEKPYKINSIRMLLWDLDERLHSYYITVSVDETKLYRIIDNRETTCKSWQTLRFPPIIAKLIKIVGKSNSANAGNCFRLVSFECSFNDKLEE